ncbi:unnamed protein product [Moneuplotes crassus]|uniref:Uncharacterized protein n=1 Tax=Euplotes crassus TaxID=5936 RepID=A0AAD1U539_EUPCR|nr:unnamed protein product [Moneuplotes crassus]
METLCLWILCLYCLVAAVQATQNGFGLEAYGRDAGEEHYSFHKQDLYLEAEDLATAAGYEVDGVRQAFVQTSDSEAVYLVRRSKVSRSEFKLVRIRHDEDEFAYETYPSEQEEFLEFSGTEVIGFVMDKYPIIDGIIVDHLDKSERVIEYHTIDPKTNQPIRSYLVDKISNHQFKDYKSAIEHNPTTIQLEVQKDSTGLGHSLFIQTLSKIDSYMTCVNLLKYNTKSKSLLLKYRANESVVDLNGIIRVTPQLVIQILQFSPSKQLKSSNSEFLSRYFCVTTRDTEQFILQWIICSETNGKTLVQVTVAANSIYILLRDQLQSEVVVLELKTGIRKHTKTFEHQKFRDLKVGSHMDLIVISETLRDSSEQHLSTFSVSRMDFQLNKLDEVTSPIQEVEQHLDGPSPQRVISLAGNLVFLSERANTHHQGGGVYATWTRSSLFVVGNSTEQCQSIRDHCEVCYSNSCSICQQGYSNINGECHKQCGDHYLQHKVPSDNKSKYSVCLPCHASCKTCSDQTEFGCLSCDSDKVFDAVKHTCKCYLPDKQFMQPNGTCTQNCGDILPARYNGVCVASCPANSDDYLQRISNKRMPKSQQKNCGLYQEHYKVEANRTRNIVIPFSFYYENEFSLSLWARVALPSSDSFAFATYGNLQLTGVLDKPSGQISLLLQVLNIETLSVIRNYTIENAFALDEWAYIGVSVYRTHRIGNTFEVNLVTVKKNEDSRSINFPSQEFELRSSKMPSLPYFLGGGNHLQTFKFTGLLNKVMVMKGPTSSSELIDNAFRFPVKRPKFYDPHLSLLIVIHSRMSPQELREIRDIVFPETGLQNKHLEIQTEELTGEPLHFCEFYTVERECRHMDSSASPKVFPTFHSLTENLNLKYQGTEDMEKGDILITDYRLFQGFIRNMDAKSKTASNFLTLGINNKSCLRLAPLPCLNYAKIVKVFLFEDKSSKHYLNKRQEISIKFRGVSQESNMKGPFSVRYFKNSTKEIFDLGIFSVLMGNSQSKSSDGPYSEYFLSASIYPDRGQNILGESRNVSFVVTMPKYDDQTTLLSIFSHDHDQDKFPYKELISFSLDCENVLPDDIKIEKQTSGSFSDLDTGLFTEAGQYMICWKSPQLESELYIPISDANWIVREEPIIYYSNKDYRFNYGFFYYILTRLPLHGDQFRLFKGSENCKNSPVQSENNNWGSRIYFWLPDTNQPLHICWREKIDQKYQNWKRIKDKNGNLLEIRVQERTDKRRLLPMIQDMSHSIGSIFHEDEEIWIQIGLSSTVIDRESKLKSLKVHKNVKSFSNEDKSIYSLECNRPREVIGRCFLKGYEQDILNTYMQKIEFTLDSSTISYTDGDKEYFLFGDEGSYHAEFFQYHYSVRKFNTTANEYIPEHGLYMKMLHGCKPHCNVVLRFHSPSSGCNPIGSTRNINWRDNTIFIPNFDKTGCKAGDKIYANASVEHM